MNRYAQQGRFGLQANLVRTGLDAQRRGKRACGRFGKFRLEFHRAVIERQFIVLKTEFLLFVRRVGDFRALDRQLW